MFSDNIELIGHQNISCDVHDSRDPRISVFDITMNKNYDTFFVNKIIYKVHRRNIAVSIYFEKYAYTVLYITNAFILEDLFYISSSVFKSSDMYKTVYDFFTKTHNFILSYDIVGKDDINAISIKKDVY